MDRYCISSGMNRFCLDLCLLKGQNAIPVKGGVSGYLDIVPNKDGYDHIAVFNPLNATEHIWITSGEWEVTEISAQTGTTVLVLPWSSWFPSDVHI